MESSQRKNEMGKHTHFFPFRQVMECRKREANNIFIVFSAAVKKHNMWQHQKSLQSLRQKVQLALHECMLAHLPLLCCNSCVFQDRPAPSPLRGVNHLPCDASCSILPFKNVHGGKPSKTIGLTFRSVYFKVADLKVSVWRSLYRYIPTCEGLGGSKHHRLVRDPRP